MSINPDYDEEIRRLAEAEADRQGPNEEGSFLDIETLEPELKPFRIKDSATGQFVWFHYIDPTQLGLRDLARIERLQRQVAAIAPDDPDGEDTLFTDGQIKTLLGFTDALVAELTTDLAEHPLYGKLSYWHKLRIVQRFTELHGRISTEPSGSPATPSTNSTAMIATPVQSPSGKRSSRGSSSSTGARTRNAG